MKLLIGCLVLLFFIEHGDLRRETENQETHHKSHSNQDYLRDLVDDNEVQDTPSASSQHEKKYPSRKKVLDDAENLEEPEKPARRVHSSKASNRSSPTTTPAQSYFEEASLCINEFDVKNEQLVKVKELKNGAYMIRLVRIEEPSKAHSLNIKDICMLHCCVEKVCDLAMLSEQRTTDGYKCYLFACNGSCTYAPHQDYTSMILKKDSSSDDESFSSDKQSKGNNDKASSSTTLTSCRSTEFSCRDGSCIPYYDVCNSYDDCPSGIDEANCSPEFLLHQRTQQENRKKPSADLESETNTDPDEELEEIVEEDPGTTTSKSITKTSNSKGSNSKSKSKNREGDKTNKNSSSSFLYNIDLDTQERVSRLQKLKEHLEETNGPEAWYHLFQTLIQQQQQDHSNIEPEQTGSSTGVNDEENFKDHLLALEQKWIADRQKGMSTSATTTTVRPRVNNRKTTVSTTKSTTLATTKRMRPVNDDDEPRTRRPPPADIEEELSEDESDDGGGGEDGDRYYWQPNYDDRRGNRYNYQQKSKTTSPTSTRRPKMKTPSNNRESTVTSLLRVTSLESDNYSHTRSFLRESTVILLLLLGLIFTIVLLVLVGFYCRDSWKRGRIFKNRSTDADYLINGLYL